MSALDFKEIAEAHTGGARDQFELFAQDFLVALGFQIVKSPDRGVDAGRDLIVQERRTGPGGDTILDWLVSCKHNAHSGKAVGTNDEINVRDRVETHKCNGFIGFYSTITSSTLATHLEALRPRFELTVFDQGKIESMLLKSQQGRAVAARYFPISFRRWIVTSQYAENPTPPVPLTINDRFFLRQPHTTFNDAQAEALGRNCPLFVIVFDSDHSTRSQLEYCLGCFMQWESTKRLVDENFVVAVGPSSDADFGKLVPEDDPLEECRWVVLHEGDVVRSESVYANASEGRKRVMSALAAVGRKT